MIVTFPFRSATVALVQQVFLFERAKIQKNINNGRKYAVYSTVEWNQHVRIYEQMILEDLNQHNFLSSVEHKRKWCVLFSSIKTYCDHWLSSSKRTKTLTKSTIKVSHCVLHFKPSIVLQYLCVKNRPNLSHNSMKILLSNLICSHLFGESVTPKTGVMVLKIQLCFTGINYILKYIQAENYGSPFPPLNKKIKKVIPFFSTSDFISTIVSLYHTILTFFSRNC